MTTASPNLKPQEQKRESEEEICSHKIASSSDQFCLKCGAVSYQNVK